MNPKTKRILDKQKELNLTDSECLVVLNYLKAPFDFSERQEELLEYILKQMEGDDNEGYS